MVELEGTHPYQSVDMKRLIQCEVMKRLMLELREKGLSDESRKFLNSRVIDGSKVEMPMHDEVKFAT